jgi:hypothetical protein
VVLQKISQVVTSLVCSSYELISEACILEYEAFDFPACSVDFRAVIAVRDGIRSELILD